jgi:hypothetical protein
MTRSASPADVAEVGVLLALAARAGLSPAGAAARATARLGATPTVEQLWALVVAHSPRLLSNRALWEAAGALAIRFWPELRISPVDLSALRNCLAEARASGFLRASEVNAFDAWLVEEPGDGHADPDHTRARSCLDEILRLVFVRGGQGNAVVLLIFATDAHLDPDEDDYLAVQLAADVTAGGGSA